MNKKKISKSKERKTGQGKERIDKGGIGVLRLQEVGLRHALENFTSHLVYTTQTVV